MWRRKRHIWRPTRALRVCFSRLALKGEVEAGFLRIPPTPELDLRRGYVFLVHRKRHQSTLLNASLSHCAMTDRDIGADGGCTAG